MFYIMDAPWKGCWHGGTIICRCNVAVSPWLMVDHWRRIHIALIATPLVGAMLCAAMSDMNVESSIQP